MITAIIILSVLFGYACSKVKKLKEDLEQAEKFRIISEKQVHCKDEAINWLYNHMDKDIEEIPNEVLCWMAGFEP